MWKRRHVEIEIERILSSICADTHYMIIRHRYNSWYYIYGLDSCRSVNSISCRFIYMNEKSIQSTDRYRKIDMREIKKDSKNVILPKRNKLVLSETWALEYVYFTSRLLCWFCMRGRYNDFLWDRYNFYDIYEMGLMTSCEIGIITMIFSRFCNNNSCILFRYYVICFSKWSAGIQGLTTQTYMYCNFWLYSSNHNYRRPAIWSSVT